MSLLITEITDIINDMNTQSLEDIEPKNITENDYLEMAEDFKNRIREKNKIIQKLQKKLILIYALVERYMDTEDTAFIEETRYILDKVLIDNIGIQSID